jgi:hypothetical protein
MSALLAFLDRLYDDIRAIETLYAMQAGKSDLRLPIDYYHDAIRAWQDESFPERLSVAWVAHDLSALRQRSGWLLSGPTVFWQDKDADYRKTLAAARNFKHWCIRHLPHLEVPLTVIQQDLIDFAHLVKNPADERLAIELRTREAEKFRFGRWEPIPDHEFWGGFAYTVGFFQELQQQLAAPEKQISIEDQRTKPRLKKMGHADWRIQGEQALKGLWVQIQHPLALKAALKPDKKNWRYDEARHVPEAEWQQMQIDCLRLSEAYEAYAVMFAAALAPDVEKDYQAQKTLLDSVITDSYALLKLVERLEKNEEKLEAFQLERLIHETDNAEMKARLMEVLRKMRVDRVGSSGTLKSALNTVMQGTQTEIDTLDQQHFQFLTSQLATYEESKKVIKELAAQGLNLAGRFVAAAAAVATGKGKGQGR